jgi:hypothetical protein
MTMPDSISALPTAAAPARVIGPETPAIGSPFTLTGIPCPAVRRNISSASAVHLRGP